MHVKKIRLTSSSVFALTVVGKVLEHISQRTHSKLGLRAVSEMSLKVNNDAHKTCDVKVDVLVGESYRESVSLVIQFKMFETAPSGRVGGRDWMMTDGTEVRVTAAFKDWQPAELLLYGHGYGSNDVQVGRGNDPFLTHLTPASDLFRKVWNGE